MTPVPTTASPVRALLISARPAPAPSVLKITSVLQTAAMASSRAPMYALRVIALSSVRPATLLLLYARAASAVSSYKAATVKMHAPLLAM